MADVTELAVTNHLMPALISAIGQRDPQLLELMESGLATSLDNPADEEERAAITIAIRLLRICMGRDPD